MNSPKSKSDMTSERGHNLEKPVQAEVLTLHSIAEKVQELILPSLGAFLEEKITSAVATIRTNTIAEKHANAANVGNSKRGDAPVVHGKRKRKQSEDGSDYDQDDVSHSGSEESGEIGAYESQSDWVPPPPTVEFAEGSLKNYLTPSQRKTILKIFPSDQLSVAKMPKLDETFEQILKQRKISTRYVLHWHSSTLAARAGRVNYSLLYILDAFLDLKQSKASNGPYWTSLDHYSISMRQQRKLKKIQWA